MARTAGSGVCRWLYRGKAHRARDQAEPLKPFEVRFETPAGEQAQVDLARFEVEFTDEPDFTRIVWLFSMVLGYSRLIWARFIVHQDLQSVLRCHIAALEAIGGAPREILYDRMKTAVIGEDADGLVIYNRSLLDLARYYGFQPKACRPYRPKTTDVIDKCFFAGSGLFFSRAQVTARRRAGRQAKALPRSLHCRPSFAAPVRARLGPRGFQPATKRA